MDAMRQSLENFYNSLKKVEQVLADHKSAAASSTEKVLAVLDEANSKLGAAINVKGGATGLAQQMDQALRVFESSIASCKEALLEKSQVRQKLENVDDKARAIVLVYGRTNAGKSTLGNFLRGKSLRDAPFDNPWKNGSLKIGSIEVVEVADGVESRMTENRDWFQEGAAETTQEIQCFTLPGLLWVDTPGFGSSNEEVLGRLAENYSGSADLVVYLDHSDNPGLASVSGKLLRILNTGKETLILINQSDKTPSHPKKDKKTGKYIKETIPKPEADRRAQEEQVRKSLRDNKKYAELRQDGLNLEDKLMVTSISMLLANKAVENDDDALYEASAFGKFLERLEGIFHSPESIGKIMSDYLYTSCLELCNMVLNGPDKNTSGLRKQIEDQQAFLDKVRDISARLDVEAETEKIATSVSLDLARELREYLNQAVAKAEREKSIELDLNPLLARIQSQCNDRVSETISHYLKDLFESAEFGKIALDAASFSGLKMSRKTERDEYEVPESYHYKRAASGVLETICSWFGKEYYGTGRKMVKKSQVIDLGFDPQETHAEISRKLGSMIPENILQSLFEAKKESLDYAVAKVEASLGILRQAEREIIEIKRNLEKKVSLKA